MRAFIIAIIIIIIITTTTTSIANSIIRFAALIIRRLIHNERVLVVNVVSDPPEVGDDQLLQVFCPPDCVCYIS
jgi:hypothetical protein